MAKTFTRPPQSHLVVTRGVAKTANFSLLYGTGAKAFRNKAAASGIFMTEEEANRIRSGWLSEYSGIAQWHRTLSNKADSTQKKGFCYVYVPESGLRPEIGWAEQQNDQPRQHSGAGSWCGHPQADAAFDLERDQRHGSTRPSWRQRCTMS